MHVCVGFAQSKLNKNKMLPFTFFAPLNSICVLTVILVATREHAQVEEEKYYTSRTEIIVEEKREMIAEEKIRKPKDEKVQHTADIPPPQREKDDWFVLLDVSPTQTPYVPPGILNSNYSLHFLLMFKSKDTYCDSVQ